MTDAQRNYYERMENDRLTSKEIDLIFHLEQAGYYDIDIYPNNSFDLEISEKYTFELSYSFELMKKSDRIKAISDSLAKVIYYSVLTKQQKNFAKHIEIQFHADFAEMKDSLSINTYSLDSFKNQQK